MREQAGAWVVELPDLIRMNQLVRGRIDLDGFDLWYDALMTDQRAVLGGVLFGLAQQARPTDSEYDEALTTAGLPATHPVAQQVWEARRERSLLNTFTADRFLMSLDENDLWAAFRLFAALFGIAQWREYRTLTANGPSSYWWHRDVLDPRVVDDLLSDPAYYHTSPRDDERIKSRPEKPAADECPQDTRPLDAIPDHVVPAPHEPNEAAAEPAPVSTDLPAGPPPDRAGGGTGGARPVSSGFEPLIRLAGVGTDFRGREWSFEDAFHVGRLPMDPSTGLTLDGPSANSVSRLHAAVSHDEVGWWITDRKSTNGTFLNGTRLGAEPAGPLRAGDIVQFSTIALRVEGATGPTERRGGDRDSEPWAGSYLERALTNAVNLVLRESVLTRCGCARRFAHLFRPEHRAAVERVERTADGIGSPPSPPPVGSDPLTALVNALTEEGHDLGQWLVLVEGGLEAQAAEQSALQAIHRDVLGGPWQRDWFDTRWRTADVVGLAKGMYDSGDYFAMPILADALQDAGCENAAVLEHCRADAPHVRGCWVVDEVLRHRSDTARLRQFGMLDAQTGVGNRRAYSFLLRRLVVFDGASLLAVEIDPATQSSATHSGSVGGRALVEIIRFLGGTLGGRGYLTRISDAGFRIILPTAELPAALAVGERLRRAVESWRWAGGGDGPEHAFTISVGVAASGHASVDRNTDAEARRLHGELEANASEALWQAKTYGGNRVCTRKPRV